MLKRLELIDRDKVSQIAGKDIVFFSKFARRPKKLWQTFGLHKPFECSVDPFDTRRLNLN